MSDFPLPPAPWMVDPDDREGMDWNNHVTDANGDRVCFMAHRSTENEPWENAAHVIAAAPELLEALEASLEFIDQKFTDKSELARIIKDQAHTAIAKAKGEN